MSNSSFTITFDFLGDNGKLKVRLSAEVEVYHSRLSYVVKNFMLPGRWGASLLPEIRLKKANGQWIHSDSGKGSDLSVSVGLAIDAYEQSQKAKATS